MAAEEQGGWFELNLSHANRWFNSQQSKLKLGFQAGLVWLFLRLWTTASTFKYGAGPLDTACWLLITVGAALVPLLASGHNILEVNPVQAQRSGSALLHGLIASEGLVLLLTLLTGCQYHVSQAQVAVLLLASIAISRLPLPEQSAAAPPVLHAHWVDQPRQPVMPRASSLKKSASRRSFEPVVDPSGRPINGGDMLIGTVTSDGPPSPNRNMAVSFCDQLADTGDSEHHGAFGDQNLSTRSSMGGNGVAAAQWSEMTRALPMQGPSNNRQWQEVCLNTPADSVALSEAPRPSPQTPMSPHGPSRLASTVGAEPADDGDQDVSGSCDSQYGESQHTNEQQQLECPADLMLDVVEQLLAGRVPDIKELQLLYACLNQPGADMYTPIGVAVQDPHITSTAMDADVEEALLTRLLGVTPMSQHQQRSQRGTPSPMTSQTSGLAGITEGSEGQAPEPLRRAASRSAAEFTDMRDALSALMSDFSPLDVCLMSDRPRAAAASRKASASASRRASLVEPHSSRQGMLTGLPPRSRRASLVEYSRRSSQFDLSPTMGIVPMSPAPLLGAPSGTQPINWGRGNTPSSGQLPAVTSMGAAKKSQGAESQGAELSPRSVGRGHQFAGEPADVMAAQASEAFLLGSKATPFESAFHHTDVGGSLHTPPPLQPAPHRRAFGSVVYAEEQVPESLILNAPGCSEFGAFAGMMQDDMRVSASTHGTSAATFRAGPASGSGAHAQGGVGDLSPPTSTLGGRWVTTAPALHRRANSAEMPNIIHDKDSSVHYAQSVTQEHSVCATDGSTDRMSGAHSFGRGKKAKKKGFLGKLFGSNDSKHVPSAASSPASARRGGAAVAHHRAHLAGHQRSSTAPGAAATSGAALQCCPCCGYDLTTAPRNTYNRSSYGSSGRTSPVAMALQQKPSKTGFKAFRHALSGGFKRLVQGSPPPSGSRSPATTPPRTRSSTGGMADSSMAPNSPTKPVMQHTSSYTNPLAMEDAAPGELEQHWLDATSAAGGSGNAVHVHYSDEVDGAHMYGRPQGRRSRSASCVGGKPPAGPSAPGSRLRRSSAEDLREGAPNTPPPELLAMNSGHMLPTSVLEYRNGVLVHSKVAHGADATDSTAAGTSAAAPGLTPAALAAAYSSADSTSKRCSRERKALNIVQLTQQGWSQSTDARAPDGDSHATDSAVLMAKLGMALQAEAAGGGAYHHAAKSYAADSTPPDSDILHARGSVTTDLTDGASKPPTERSTPVNVANALVMLRTKTSGGSITSKAGRGLSGTMGGDSTPGGIKHGNVVALRELSQQLLSRTNTNGSAGGVDSPRTRNRQADNLSTTPSQRVAAARPSPAMLDKAEQLLVQAENAVHFNAFELAEATQGHALSALSFYLINRNKLSTLHGLHPVKLARWLRHVESGYNPRNPYHNAVHAADVLQTLHVTLHISGMTKHYVDELGLLSCYLSAIVHDFEHQGLTNDFLINTSDTLAIRYNDRAPLENHHLAAAFAAMHVPGMDFAASMIKTDYEKMRKLMIDLVLATDMKQHFALVGQYNTTRRQLLLSPVLSQTSWHQNGEPGPRSSSTFAAPLSPSRRLDPNNTSGRPSINRMHALVSARSSRSTNNGRQLVQTLSSGMAQSRARSERGGHNQGLDGAGGYSTSREQSVVSGPCSQVDTNMMWNDMHRQSLQGGPDNMSGLASPARAGSNSHEQAATGSVGVDSKALEARLSTPENIKLVQMFSSTSARLTPPPGIDVQDREHEDLVPLDDAERLLSLQMALKISDLGHLAEGRDVHLKWVSCLEEEFFRQGDKERDKGLAISPLFDRHKPGVTKSQVGFFEVVVLPLFRGYVSSFPNARPLLTGVLDNYKHWLKQKEKHEKQEQQEKQQQEQQQQAAAADS